jgi:hypothetical protein
MTKICHREPASDLSPTARALPFHRRRWRLGKWSSATEQLFWMVLGTNFARIIPRPSPEDSHPLDSLYETENLIEAVT